MGDGLLFLHIIGVAGWIGGGLFGIYAGGRLARAGGEAHGRALELIYAKAGIYFGVAFVLVVGSGIGLVITEDEWGWGDTFIWIAVAAIVVSGAWEGLVSRKAGEALIDELKTTGTTKPATFNRWRFAGFGDVAILLVAVWAMITKIGT